MVDVNTSGNHKLWARGVRMVHEITDLPLDLAEVELRKASGSVKLACTMHAHQTDPDTAAQILARSGGNLRSALASAPLN
jgi:N-acetylmuramic acid 6-phosphate etherase